MSEREPENTLSCEEQEFFDQEPGEPDPMGIGLKAAERARSRRSRGLFMFVALFLFVGLLTWLLADDLLYFFHSGSPEDLDRAEELPARSLEHNSYIKVAGIARDMCIRAEVFSTRLRYLYLLGSEMGARILIQAPDPDEGDCLGAVERTFEGRLVDLGRPERYDAVLGYYREHFPAAPTEGPIYLLEHEVRPGQAWYYPLALGALSCLAALNFFMLRRRRRLEVEPAAEG